MTPANLRRIIAKLTGCDPLTPGRAKSVCRARRVYSWALREFLGCSYPEVGRLCGGQDHTTVMNAVKRFHEVEFADAWYGVIHRELLMKQDLLHVTDGASDEDMGFTKLHTTILDSSIWGEPHHVRIVWVTMLAMAGADGVVKASLGGLARRAVVSRDECQDAIDRFIGPDPDSRDGTSGERIEVVPDGWLLLNHAKYRDKQTPEQEATAKRVREHRARRKVTQRNVTSPPVTPHLSGSPPEAEAEIQKTEARGHIGFGDATASPSASHAPVTRESRSNNRDTPENLREDPANVREPEAKPKAKRRTQVPEDLVPNAAAITLANELEVILSAELPKFLDHHRAKGTLMSDWQAALRTWIRNAEKWRPKETPLEAQLRRVEYLRQVEAAGGDVDEAEGGLF